MIENFALIVSLILIGTVIKRSSFFPENTADVLTSFIINISLPAMILISIPKLPMTSEALIPVIGHWTMYIIHLILLYFVGKLFSLSKSVLGVLVVVSTVGNTAFLGIPVVETYFGKQGLGYAVLYDQLGSGIAFLLMTTMLLPFFLGREHKSLKEALRMLLLFPPFVALLIAFIFKFYPAPGILNQVFEKIAATLIPCAMIAVGFQMKYRLSIEKLIPISIGLVLKMAIIPVIFYTLKNAMGITGLATDISVIQSAMPPMVTAGAIAMSADLEKDIAAALVGYGLLISFISLPIIKLIL